MFVIVRSVSLSVCLTYDKALNYFPPQMIEWVLNTPLMIILEPKRYR